MGFVFFQEYGGPPILKFFFGVGNNFNVGLGVYLAVVQHACPSTLAQKL